MKIHEFQAKQLFSRFGVAVPKGGVATTPEEAARIARELGGRAVVKAQIHAGGRGKAGGVKLAASPEEAASIAKSLLGRTLVTHQTGPEGREVRRVLVEETLEIEKEYYLGIVVDRSSESPVLMASSEGGVEIEKVAAETPEKILKLAVPPEIGFWPFAARRIVYGLGMRREAVPGAVSLVSGLFKAFSETDASLVEVNPLVVTKSGAVVALDGKMTFDDNALYRRPDLREMRDLTEEDPLEIEASKFGLNYIKLNGNVGCMVNGAGLAMATMDIIKLAGGEPANFLDVGGGATTEAVTAAFKILLSDPHVRAVLVNIFGGIMRCDIVAEGIVTAAKQVGMKVPVVVRLEGTNVEKGQEVLRGSGINVIVASGMKDAAEKVVAAAKASA
jgi:succinyl-CoA synthetase beta subunit